MSAVRANLLVTERLCLVFRPVNRVLFPIPGRVISSVNPARPPQNGRALAERAMESYDANEGIKALWKNANRDGRISRRLALAL